MSELTEFVPALPFIDVSEGRPFLRGTRCGHCQAVVTGGVIACPSCGARDLLEPIRIGETGALHTFTIVHRSLPGITTPFIAGVADIDGGGSLKGTFIDVDPDPERLLQGLRVQVIYRDTGQRTADGKRFLSYYFTPEGATSS